MYEPVTKHIEPLENRSENVYLWVEDLERGGFTDHDCFGTLERYFAGE